VLVVLLMRACGRLCLLPDLVHTLLLLLLPKLLFLLREQQKASETACTFCRLVCVCVCSFMHPFCSLHVCMCLFANTSAALR
jgi:hypothetical protein